MAYEKRTPRHDWRSKLTDMEREEVAQIEDEIATLKADLAAAVARINPIRNRAIQRCRYEEATAQ